MSYFEIRNNSQIFDLAKVNPVKIVKRLIAYYDIFMPTVSYFVTNDKEFAKNNLYNVNIGYLINVEI